MKKFLLVILFAATQVSVNAQNVGIGTNSPTRAKLELHGAVGTTSAIFGGEGTGISLQRNFPSIGFNQYYNNGSKYIGNGFGAVQFLDVNSGHMVFDMFGSGATNNNVVSTRRALLISKDGRMTVGSGDVPPSMLYVARGDAIDGTAVFAGTKHRSHFNFNNEENTYIRAGKDSGRVIINDIPGGKVIMSGKVGVNTTNPASTMTIVQKDGQGLSLVNPNSSVTWQLLVGSISDDFYVGQNGFIKGWFRSSDGAYITYSDARLKTHVRHLPPLLQKIGKLKAVEYEMIDANPRHQKSIGFLAQEVEKIFPELVNISADTIPGHKSKPGLRSLNYTDFGVLAIKGIQEQQALIDAQEMELRSQREEINALKTSLAQLLATKTK